MPDDMPLDPRQFLGSIARLQQAGIIETISHDERTGQGSLSWTPAYLKLLHAGRHVFDEPQFQAVWATGDPLAVRAWIEREAARLPDAPPTDRPQGARKTRRSDRR